MNARDGDSLDELRARIDELERERFELFARTNAEVAGAQERGYWLARWQVDLNALMRRRSVAHAARVVKAMQRGGRPKRRD